MTLITKPDMEFIWASGGAIVEPSDVKKQTGWTPEVPPHQWENWIQNRQDNYLAHINQRGTPEWDSNTEYEAAGLSYVQGSNGVVYKSVAASGPASTTQDPTTDVTGIYWTIAFAPNTLATETVAGIAELSTQAEAETGTNDTTVMTPLKVKQAIDQFAGSDLPLGYFSGFNLSNNVGAPNTTLDVGVGIARDSANTVAILLTSTLSGILQDTGAWTAGDNQNKLDTGVKANNTWYHIFAIRKTSDGTGDILFSLSPSAPTMPTGYAGFIRISSAKTDASGNILAFFNYGRRMFWKTPPLDVDILAGGAVNAAYALSVPTGVRVIVKGSLYARGGEALTTFRPTDFTAITASFVDFRGGIGIGTTGSPDAAANSFEALSDTSGRLHFATNTASDLRVLTYGWSEF